jgi:hypothetical protein
MRSLQVNYFEEADIFAAALPEEHRLWLEQLGYFAIEHDLSVDWITNTIWARTPDGGFDLPCMQYRLAMFVAQVDLPYCDFADIYERCSRISVYYASGY